MTPWTRWWSPEAMLESSRHIAETMNAASEAWWALWRDSFKLRWPGMPWPPAGVWIPPADAEVDAVPPKDVPAAVPQPAVRHGKRTPRSRLEERAANAPKVTQVQTRVRRKAGRHV